MGHAGSGSQAPPFALPSCPAMASPPTTLDAPHSPKQALYHTPNHRVTKARYVTSTDARGYVPVYEYPLNGQWIMMDTDDGYVLWTGIWKALGNSKADIVKILESQPDLATKLRRVRGGYLKMQGTWMARDVALELARRVAWNIRYDLIPLFGPSFPDSCLSPDQPGYGKVVTRPPNKKTRSKKSICTQPSPPNGSVPLPLSHDSPISPSAESATRAYDFFESPVEPNLSIVPERAFDFVEGEGGVYTRRDRPADMQFASQNQSTWTSLGASGAAIKEEAQSGMYEYPSGQAGHYAEPYVYTNPAQQTRRGSIPMSSYPTSPSSSTYSYVEGGVKHEQADSVYSSFSPVESYTSGSAQSPQSPQYHQQQQYSQQAGTTAYAAYTGPHHERSRSDSRYAPYQNSGAYGSPTQGYMSAPASARGVGFPAQGQGHTGMGYHIDQYQTSPTHAHLHMSPQQQHPSLQQNHVSPQQQHMSPPQNHAQMSPQHMAQGQQYGTYDYGYPTYGSDQAGLRLNLEQQQPDEREAQYRQYPNQY